MTDAFKKNSRTIYFAVQTSATAPTLTSGYTAVSGQNGLDEGITMPISGQNRIVPGFYEGYRARQAINEKDFSMSFTIDDNTVTDDLFWGDKLGQYLFIADRPEGDGSGMRQVVARLIINEITHEVSDGVLRYSVSAEGDGTTGGAPNFANQA